MFNEQARTKALSEADASCYEQLVKSFIFEMNSRIISFNYDTILDEALFRRFAKTWAYERIHLAGINSYPVAPGAEADLLYIKPHGSLNMLVCPNCQRTHIQWFAPYVPRGGGELASNNRRCAHCKQVSPQSGLLNGMVVPPLYDKEVIDGSKKAIVRAFAWTNNVVSIGFSYPEQDSYFFDCMAEGLGSNRNDKVTISLVLQNQAGTQTLMQRLLAEPRLAFLTDPKFAIEPTSIAGFESL